MNLRQANAIAAFVSDVGEWADKCAVHEAHLREAGLHELAHLSEMVRGNFMALLVKFAEMARKDG